MDNKCQNCYNFKIEIVDCSTDRETQKLEMPYCVIDKMLFVGGGCQYFKEKNYYDVKENK